MLLGAVGFVLLIACANVANLLLSRAVATAARDGRARGARRQPRAHHRPAPHREPDARARRRSPRRRARARGRRVGPRRSSPRTCRASTPSPSTARVLLFTAVVSIVSGLLFGLAPALGTGRIDLHATLKDAGRGSAGAGAIWGRGQLMRRLLVIAELALAVMLLVGAGLLVRSFARLQTVAPGFNAAGVLTLELTMSGQKYANGGLVLEMYQRLWERLDALPGVMASGGVTSLPLSQYFAWGPDHRRRPHARARRSVPQRRSARRGRPLLRDDADPARPRAALHRRGPRAGPARDHRRRVPRARDLAGRGSDRQARPARRRQVRRALANRRGRRRTREAVRARYRRPDRALHAAPAGAVARAVRRRAHESRPGRALVVGGAGHPRARSRSPALPRDDDERARGGVAGAPAVSDAAALAVCGRRDGPRGHRHLQRDGLPGEPGHARDRHPHRARRHAAGHPRVGAASRRRRSWPPGSPRASSERPRSPASSAASCSRSGAPIRSHSW